MKEARKTERYDIAIIGTGPAGVSAALTAKNRNKSILLLGSRQMSEKVAKAHEIRNYPGLPFVKGEELAAAFRDQLDRMEIPVTETRIGAVYAMGDYFALQAGEEMLEAKTVILATGVVMAKTLPGEEELLGRGVSYCATCDGFLYKGKTAAVYCTDERMEHDITYLEEICGKLYIYTSFGYTTDAENAEVLRLPVKKLDGGMKCDSIELTDGTKIDVDGIFILRPAIAPSTVLPGLEMDGAHIKVGRSQETNFKGCFAAGDCTGRPYQIAKAVGEGNIAAHAIIERLSGIEKEN